jgi:hypothetical protein
MARSNGVLKENGHASPPNGTVEKKKTTVEEDIYEEENIFLFIPNVIGKKSHTRRNNYLCSMQLPNTGPEHRC